MTILVTLLVALLRALVPALADRLKPRAFEARRQDALRGRLQAKIQARWAAILVLGVFSVTGCSRVVYVPHGEPVRLGESLRNVRVWVIGPDGQPVAGTMTIPEGWYALPDPGK